MRESTLREVPRAAPRPLAERSAGIDHVQRSHRAQNRALSLRVPADLDHRGDRDHSAVGGWRGLAREDSTLQGNLPEEFGKGGNQARLANRNVKPSKNILGCRHLFYKRLSKTALVSLALLSVASEVPS
jgi:hypothetical protein